MLLTSLIEDVFSGTMLRNIEQCSYKEILKIGPAICSHVILQLNDLRWHRDGI